MKLRLLIFVILVGTVYNSTRAGPVMNLVKYFTNWSLLATTFTCGSSITIIKTGWDQT